MKQQFYAIRLEIRREIDRTQTLYIISLRTGKNTSERRVLPTAYRNGTTVAPRRCDRYASTVRPFYPDGATIIFRTLAMKEKMRPPKRKEGDSNPRYGNPYDSLANCWFQPLTHPSVRQGMFAGKRHKGNSIFLITQILFFSLHLFCTGLFRNSFLFEDVFAKRMALR